MKYIILLISTLMAASALAQKYNTDDGLAAKGYDVVAYFNNKAVKGKKEFQAKHDGLIYRFSTQANKAAFEKEPNKYVPQYGGWCAYAMGTSGKYVDIDPETFEIRDGKLYLFYNKFFTNTYDSWLTENPEKLVKEADKNWEKQK